MVRSVIFRILRPALYTLKYVRVFAGKKMCCFLSGSIPPSLSLSLPFTHFILIHLLGSPYSIASFFPLPLVSFSLSPILISSIDSASSRPERESEWEYLNSIPFQIGAHSVSACCSNLAGMALPFVSNGFTMNENCIPV